MWISFEPRGKQMERNDIEIKNRKKNEGGIKSKSTIKKNKTEKILKNQNEIALQVKIKIKMRIIHNI